MRPVPVVCATDKGIKEKSGQAPVGRLYQKAEKYDGKIQAVSRCFRPNPCPSRLGYVFSGYRRSGFEAQHLPEKGRRGRIGSRQKD
ncbi:MAG TPA: hypothetical protein DDY86_12335, partial [Syntrophaceae bacterium]|nr:hypothetical protein [Syntrophaceae bacterium]